MKLNMGEHIDDVIAALPYYELEELEKQGREVRSSRYASVCGTTIVA